MIWAQLSEKDVYRGIHPRLDRALDLLTDLPPVGAVAGRPVEIEGKDLYYTLFEYETLPYEETFFEAHRQYLDIHVVLSGREWVEIAHPEGLEEYTKGEDFWGYHGKPQQRILMEASSFLVVFPGDAHRLKISDGNPEHVTKVVFKVLL